MNFNIQLIELLIEPQIVAQLIVQLITRSYFWGINNTRRAVWILDLLTRNAVGLVILKTSISDYPKEKVQTTDTDTGNDTDTNTYGLIVVNGACKLVIYAR